MPSEIISTLEKIVTKGDTALEKDIHDYGFYGLGLDPDGVPRCFGNADDVMEDGFELGERQGEYDLAVKMLKMLKMLKKDLDT